MPGLKSRCGQGCIPSGHSRAGAYPCLFQFLEAAHIPQLMTSSSIFKASSAAFASLAVSLTSRLPLYWVHWII